MATVVKNFRIKSGLVVEGTTGTINGSNILTESAAVASYILNLVGGATLVKSVEATQLEVSGAGKLSVKANVFDSYGSASAAQDAAATDATNKADAAQSAAQAFATSADTALYGTVTSDIATAKSAAESNAQNFANTAESNAISAAAQDATNKANAAQTAAELTASNANASLYNTVSSDISTAKSEAISSANTYTDGKVSDLVASAPAMLDTLNELAVAIANNPNYATDVANLVATKADTTYVNDEISAVDSAAQGYASTAQSNAESFATTAANNAQTAAETFASGLSVNYDATGAAATAQQNAIDYTDGYVGAVLNGSEPFTGINLNSVTSQRAVQTTLSSVSTGSSVMSWAKADYGSAKLWVKFATATHSQISELLVTTDGSNNVAVTEFAIVGTNGNMGTASVSYLSGNLAVEVDTVYANTTVTVSATLIK